VRTSVVMEVHARVSEASRRMHTGVAMCAQESSRQHSGVVDSRYTGTMVPAAASCFAIHSQMHVL
jgi:hypothetical protein